MKDINEVFVFITMILAIVLVVFIIARYTYLIKKALIEKGVYQDQKNNKLKYLDLGCIVFGLGMGLLISSIFTTFGLSEDATDLLVWGTILVFGATGLIVAHFIRKRLEK
ncbi:DUF6249 domain-containing protein [Aquimarina litoralis]|uniref:DUF6249 domain-containing protein n=1 Tax=Aquimarina litoralis TaxID=584605 RepID=UPI001C591299|nr:DUF6249 domain-containing protein [Aquimarina litoralis]MBW1296462.1 hypothetical protein [Aquimarina litoralis]